MKLLILIILTLATLAITIGQIAHLHIGKALLAMVVGAVVIRIADAILKEDTDG